MPRPERALPSEDDAVVRFAAALRRLREEAGKPTYRVLGKRAHYSPTALAVAAGGHKLPSLAVTQAFVRACGGDVAEWTARWRQIAIEPTDDPKPDTGAPYLGLTAFQARDADRFFGRDNLTTELLEQVRQRRFVGVFGASGSGKSSVLRAGLVAKTDELAVVFTPGPHPMEECAVQLAALTDTAASSWRADIVADPGSLHLRIRQAMVNDERDLLLVVDQFEELFTLCGDENERAGFITALTTAAGAETSRTRIVLGVRADFYGHCGQYPELVAALRGGQVLLGPMSVDELREAITAPAIRSGCKVETALVARVISEAAGQPGVLPLVSHALLETWRRRHGILLTVTGYDAVGGIHQAIARTAETVFTSLDADQQRLAREIFLRLTALGEGTEDTKRRTHQSELDTSDPDTVLVLEHLTRARLVIRDRDTLEIAHEALIRCWPRLRNWLRDDREGLRLHRQLTEATAVWTSLERDPGALYRGTRLAQIRDWATTEDTRLSAAERAFLAASLTAEAADHAATRRRARRLRQLVVVLAALLILTTTSMIVAVQAQNSISDQRNTALAQRVADQATALRPADPELAVQLSLAAYRLAPNPHTRSSLLSTLPRSVVSHPTEVYAVAFSADGQTLATGGGDDTARLWNVDDPQHPAELAALTGHRGAVRAVAYSPDGSTLATSSDDHTARLWNVDDPRHPVDLATLDGHTDAIYGLAFSPDGRMLATGSDDHTVRLWTVNDSQHLLEPAIITGPTDSVDVVAFSPDGRTLATGGDDQAVRLWNVADPRRPVELATLTDTAEVYAVAFSPDGRTLATGGDDHAVRLWDVADLRHPTELATLTGHTDSVEWIAVSPDGRTLASSGDDHAVRLWNVTDPRHPTELATLTSHTDSTDSVAFSPDGRTVATGSDDRTTQLFDTNFEQVIAHACDSVRSPITATQWNRYFPDLSYQPPCAD